ncbi:MAG TPA: hypothetical protein ENL00_04870 [Nitratifractor sp.]|nr:hypothetical protein [Campylobacterota bacterium]HHD75131.1 hypothetical protein [Nitratifractor sp.]
MKKLIILALVSTFAMSGFFNDAQIKQEKEQKAEAARLCKIYTAKTEKYKETMRNDDLAKATLKNYVRVENKYCGKSHS